MTPWQTPVVHHPLDRTTVHLWRFPLTDTGPIPDLLSADEHQRAGRFLLPDKAAAFSLARTRLRQILARYLVCPPQKITFTTTLNGKPQMIVDMTDPLFFNLAHAGRWGLCAVTRVAEVGVDLETISSRLAFEPLARQFFTADEYGALQRVAESRRRRQFYRLWTRKEAWLKGKGGGFSEPDLGLDPAHLAATSAVAGGWWVKNMPVARGYVGALAVAGTVTRVERWNWCD